MKRACIWKKSVSSSDDVVKYDTFDKSCDGSKELPPGMNDMFKHRTGSESSESVSTGTNYEDPSVKCIDILNDIYKIILLLQSYKVVLGIKCLYQRTVGINVDIMAFVISESIKKW